MSLNLKDEETVALVSEVAKRLGTTKTAAVRLLARERLAELDQTAAVAHEDRVRRATAWLERDVWPHVRGESAPSKAQQEELLGFDR